jgi:hypothetical protein
MTRVFTRLMLIGGMAGFATLTGCNTNHQPAKHEMTARAAAIASYRQPTPAEVQDFVRTLEPSLDRSKTTVRVIKRPNGAKIKHFQLDGGFQSVMIARRNPDGTMSQACVDSTEQATQFLSQSSAKPLAHTSNPAAVR